MSNSPKPTLLEYLNNFASEGKVELFKKRIQERTNHVTVVMEDIYQAQNTNAVLRSCDCFGIQNVHIIENKNKFKINNDISLGSSKWVNINRYNKTDFNTLDCYSKLKEQGYKIVATSPHQGGFSLYDIPINEKIAVVFGTEKRGLSQEALNNSDAYLTIPMYGFTESYNISVSAALCLYELTKRMREIDIEWQLSENEQYDTLLSWTKSSVKMAHLLIKKYKELS